jgi:hypothetical protein
VDHRRLCGGGEQDCFHIDIYRLCVCLIVLSSYYGFLFLFSYYVMFFILNDIYYLPVVGRYVCMYAFMWFLYTLHLLVLVLYFFLSYIYYIYLFYLFIYFSLLVVETVCYHGRPGWYLVAGTTMTNSNNSWQYIYIYIYIYNIQKYEYQTL